MMITSVSDSGGPQHDDGPNVPVWQIFPTVATWVRFESVIHCVSLHQNLCNRVHLTSLAWPSVNHRNVPLVSFGQTFCTAFLTVFSPPPSLCSQVQYIQERHQRSVPQNLWHQAHVILRQKGKQRFLSFYFSFSGLLFLVLTSHSRAPFWYRLASA